MEFLEVSIFRSDHDVVCVHSVNNTVDIGNDADTRVNCCLVLHTGTDNRVFCLEKRNCLTLHVRTHQSSVGIVVLEEWDHRCCDRYNHLWRYVHVVYLLALYDFYHVAVTNRYHLVFKGVFLGQRFVRLCNDKFVFTVSSHIFYFIEDLAGLFVDTAVRRLNKAVFVDSCKGSQIGNQTDVRAFRGLNRAHSSVMAVVYVSYLESRTVSGKTARAQRGQTSLMGQLCQRVVLVHELGQRRGTEEFLDCCHNRTDVDQSLWSDDLHILCLGGHSLTDDTLHSGEADAELVLQQLADGTDSSVAQMVDVVGGADAVAQTADIVDGSKDIILDDMLWNQVVHSFLDGLTQVLVGGAAVENLAENRETNLFIYADFFQLVLSIAGNIVQNIDHAVGDYLNNLVAALQENGINACALDFLSFCTGKDFVRLCHHFAGAAVDDWLCHDVSVNTAGNSQLLIIFIASHTGEVISSCIEEQRIDMGLCAVYCWRFARTQLSVDLQQSLLGIVGAVLFDGRNDTDIVAKEIQNLCIAGKAQSTDKGGNRQLSVFINTDIEDIVGVGLIFQPCAAVWNYGRSEKLFTSLVAGYAVVHTRRTHQLRNDNTFCAVDDKCTAWCHNREITHEDILLFDLAGFLVQEAGAHAQRSGKGCVALLTLFDTVFRFFVKTVVDKVKYQIALIV